MYANDADRVRALSSLARTLQGHVVMAHEGCRCPAFYEDRVMGVDTPEGRYADVALEERVVGVDTQEGRFGDVSVFRCQRCGQHWLHYLYEHEAFTGSGRWWHGPISPDVAASVTAKNALAVLGTLEFYYVGGSHYGGRVYKLHGPIGPIYPV